ncbi:MAG: chorismate mutase [Oscillospiraceae bacterium]|jgi:chorismate mutase/prephenate dehydratase|nr:chorismate mutase [Oscillospiraceae bacterium]
MTREELRAQIDAVDATIAAAFAARMDLARQVAQTKRGGAPVLDKARELEVAEKFAAHLPAPLTQYGQSLLETLLSLSRSYQRNLLLAEKPQGATVAVQGVEGAFGHCACLALFNEPNILFFRNFAGVFSAVEQGLCTYGVLPVENSTAGSVEQVRSLMGQYHFRTVRAVRLRVHQCLLVTPGTRLENIREVRSHPQALLQCGEFLQSLPHAHSAPSENTATAAREVAELGQKDVAAIASPACAKLYGLEILVRDIADKSDNFTRFLCIERADEGFEIPEHYEEIAADEDA